MTSSICQPTVGTGFDESSDGMLGGYLFSYSQPVVIIDDVGLWIEAFQDVFWWWVMSVFLAVMALIWSNYVWIAMSLVSFSFPPPACHVFWWWCFHSTILPGLQDVRCYVQLGASLLNWLCWGRQSSLLESMQPDCNGNEFKCADRVCCCVVDREFGQNTMDLIMAS